MSGKPDSTEVDPLLPLSKQQEGAEPSPSRDIPDEPLLYLEEAANDVYEAVIENDEEYDEDEHNEDVVWLREQRLLNKTIHWFRRPSVLMIASITFLLAFASSSAESTRQVITLKLSCNALGAENCSRENAQVLMSNLQLGYSICGAIIMLVSSGKISPMSDLYGRRIFIIAVVACFFVGRTLKFLIMYNFDSLQFYPMIGCEIFTNLCGGIMSLLALSNCYISDVAEPHQRIYSLGLSIAAMFVGLSIGPLVGNFIISLTTKFGSTVELSSQEFIPLKLELLLLFVDLMIAIFVLPESRSEKARKKSRSLSRSSSQLNLQVATAQPPSKMETFLNQINFLKPLKLLWIPRELVSPANLNRINSDRFAILVLVSIDCAMSTLAISFGEIFILYGIYNYNWSPSNLGQFLAIACASKAIVLILLSPVISHKIFQHGFGFRVFKKRIDMVDFSMCLLGLVCEVIGIFGYSLAPSTFYFFSCTVICGFGSLVSPSLSSAIVKFYPETKIGELFGAVALLKNLFALVAPIFYISIYKYSLSKLHRPGLVFLVAGSLLTFCTVMLIIAKRVIRLDRNTRVPSLSRPSSIADIVEPPSPQHLQSTRQNSFTDLHRKNSFIQKERTGSSN
ncbi:uncharacterized protein LODBEIA_P07530 [Lodderomyces beijingensis]|uniref:Major facilitator superfamily (MFS) profile domain-containing protein n=1 Tax=Lodderomyces beijingensis TaxID=1775926 RepID=A0ABP0ZFA6_9ASCO